MQTRISLLPLAFLALPLGAQTPTRDLGAEVAPAPSLDLTWNDFDADGLSDTVVVAPEGRVALLRQRTDASFEDATARAGLDHLENVAFVLARDYDADELVDLLIGSKDGSVTLWKNFGLAFVDVTKESGLDVTSAAGGLEWTDFNNDGRLDLAVATADGGGTVHLGQPGGFRPQVIASTVGGAGSGAGGGSSASGSTVAGTGVLAGATVSPGGSSAVGPATLPFLACAPRVLDAQTGGCLEASSAATLGMLYPLSQNLFVDDGLDRVGVGTTAPTSTLSVNGSADFDGKVKIGGDGPLSSSFFFEVESTADKGLRVFDFPGRLVAAWHNGGTQDGATVRHGGLATGEFWDIGQQSDNSFAFSNGPGAGETVRILPAALGEPGRVGIGTASPSARLEVDGNVRATEYVRMGSETGTTQGPAVAFNYQGMIVRRCVSTDQTVGNVVARSQSMRIERDGTPNGLRLAWDAGSVQNQVAYGTALTNGGTLLPIVINLGAPAAAGNQPLFAATDVVRLDVTFGTVFNTREHTELTLIRQNGDNWWVGSLTSTWNQ